MKYEKIPVAVDGTVQAALSLYIQEDYPDTYGERRRPLVLICPGGGYEHVSVREGEPVAFQFLTAGCHAAVLWYDISRQGVCHPQELKELAWSVAYIREHADQYAVDRDKILVAGFSAGGHLAASLGCFWDKAWLEEEMQMQKTCYQPNGMILSYPVITSGASAHRDSFANLMGQNASRELEQALSLENQVTDKVPPVFMWHTVEDRTVPLENSLMFAAALLRAGVNFEYHVFPHGGHGYALATKETAAKSGAEIEPQCAQWIELCKNWLKCNFVVL
ncbi:MAG: alpha/beta hydrolase [Lachnospiraceae bacterium]|nr:alpha/beta hydrolase [Lachnospiraceae bacterium]MDE7028436.1 alpha/beta hydrolase [Lachnospiraceae bacterium]